MKGDSSRDVRVSAPNSDADPAFQSRVEVAAARVGNATKLAEASGISRRTVGTYIAGDAEPSRPKLIAMARAANVRLEWLATGEGTMEAEPSGSQAAPKLIPDVLATVIQAVEEMLSRQDVAATPAEKASLIMSVYNLRIKDRT